MPFHPVPGERPVMFNAVRRHPLGRSSNQSTAASRLEVIEKLLEPHAASLIDVYFDKVHKCYPLLDEAAFRRQYRTAKTRLSPALLASLYAQSLVYWRQTLPAGHHCPDVRYIWNQACEALYFELYQSPGLSTIVAILLNISGRPLSSMIGNATLLGAAISLAHCLGLNRNCLSWALSDAEKGHRIRLWWAITIYDKWSSVAYGTPPQIQSSQHDVPYPSQAMFISKNTGPGHDNGAGDDDDDDDETIPQSLMDDSSIFIAFVTLTDVVDVYLRHVFDLTTDLQQPGVRGQDAGTFSTELENRLAQWADSLPHDLRRTIIRGTTVDTPGSANLRLSYLYIRLLSRKLGLDSGRHHLHQHTSPAAQTQRQRHAREAAEDIVMFVQELSRGALADFWQSFNAFALSSTAAFLIRSALQQESQQQQQRQQQPVTPKRSTAGSSRVATDWHAAGSTSAIASDEIYIKLAADLIAALDSYRREAGWDLANICIAQYAPVVEKIQAGLACASSAPPGSAATPEPTRDHGMNSGAGAVGSGSAGTPLQDAQQSAHVISGQGQRGQREQIDAQEQSYVPFDMTNDLFVNDLFPEYWDNMFSPL
ncbi:fungal-specific transcription factor domain-containing protein [Microdochium trichocladiopsis]|uniref:Fungal-specific transcription factor domain-containing protein n=1 Tax=Microdochium trichocladiopsis TaxID=1682393 RepID=A0A9P9BLD8_9PEZI|nr:fungal-specific transcription factor domain-containing protein [Microdochium trichocladiopsis]KAH7024789.1 fungal-specific transcription factor domain-containing protein [Microdochium trichocladiopsis]